MLQSIPAMLSKGVVLPKRTTEGASGYDLRANIENPIILQPLERRLIPTGVRIAMPNGYEAQVRPRSGLALKHGITVLNTPGTVDADYRGDIGVILVNLSNMPFTVAPQERIAQLVFQRVETPEIYELSELPETDRGSGGYGSTGTK